VLFPSSGFGQTPLGRYSGNDRKHGTLGVREKNALTALVAALGLLAGFVSSASAERLISEPGEGSGQTDNPQGIAVDSSNGRLYVADQGNQRVDVFDAEGNFEMAFGWGVDNGEAKLQSCTTTCQSGIAGSGKGQFNTPTSIAVDDDPLSPSFHDVYVVDSGNRRVEKFSPSGEFLLAFGKSGTGEGEFSSVNGSSISVDVAPGGTVYVVDTIESAPSTLKIRLQKFEPAGTVVAPQHVLLEGAAISLAMAVDSSGDFYLAVGGEGRSIRKYDGSGAELEEIAGSNLTALDVDAAGHLFAAELEPAPAVGLPATIVEYDAAGNPVRRFGYGILQGAAKGIARYESAGGDIYASEAGRVIQLDFPPPSPVVFPEPCGASSGNVKATLRAQINPEGKATDYRFEYLTQAQFESGGFENPSTVETTAGSLPPDFSLHPVSAAVSGLAPETIYRCRVIASSEDGEVIGQVGEFKTKPPIEIVAAWASAVGLDSATLNAEVNPLGISATGFFQYIEDSAFQEDGMAGAAIVPIPPQVLEFGAAESPVVASVAVQGLRPCTLYRYVLHAEDPFASRELASKTFRTFCGIGELPDGRRYELVSPTQKNNAEVAVPGTRSGTVPAGEYLKIQAADPGGDAFTFTSFTSFADAQSAPGTSQYLATRGAEGWGTENISPFGFLDNPLIPTFRGFTPDLAFGAAVVTDPPLTPEAQGGSENLYLRNNATGALRALTVEAPGLLKGQEFCTRFAGASADGSRAFFAASGALAGAPKGNGFSLYEWSSAAGLRPVSVLPGSKKAAIPTPGTSFGGAHVGCGMEGPLARAVSSDGRRAFWTYKPEEDNQPSRLLARIDGEETIQLDANVDGAGPSGNGSFWTASTDGGKVFFIGGNRLVAGADPKDLYRYDLDTRTLSDLTKDGAEAAQVQGVVGTADDGSHAYFVATGNLTGTEENDNGDVAQAGQFNLYRWHEGEGLRYIATLGSLDATAWSQNPSTRTARVSPDGLHLAFLSTAAKSLSGYDNSIASGSGCRLNSEGELVGEPLCPEAYLYSAESGDLTCVSCNPSGARPAGPALLPGWSNPFEGPHYLSNDGSRFFFESRDRLSPDDLNDKRDVYEAERPGAGSCTEGNSAFDPESGVCLLLVSSGRDADESYLLDASSSGRDVFLATRSRLVGSDKDENYDVYDARIGGGFPEPAPLIPCTGEACRPAPSALPPAPANATDTFVGPGTRKAKRHKAKRHKHHHTKQHRRKAKQRGGRR
jgi:DNA-binding beta-propeller fold protein YncE